MKTKQQKREEAAERQAEYNALTTQQKLERAKGKKESERLAKKLVKERESK